MSPRFPAAGRPPPAGSAEAAKRENPDYARPNPKPNDREVFETLKRAGML